MRTSFPAVDSLIAALRAALRDEGHAWTDVRLERLRDKGLAHDHVRLVGTGALARIPKQSQLQLGAIDNLAYQATCFERASAAGHAPRLLGLLAPSEHLPRGALLVEEIVGRSAVLPDDLGAIMRALAALHSLAVPRNSERAPILDAADPLQALLDEIAAQAGHLPAAGVEAAVRLRVETELARLHVTCARCDRPPRHLIAFDGHPGNFMVRADGRAVLVDLEKCRYSYPGLDLAHATLYTSTTWDLDTHAVLDLPTVLQAYSCWTDAMDPVAAGAALQWHVHLRRAMWLWSITWCAKWRAVSGAAARVSADGEDWSAERSHAGLVAHVRNRVDHYLSRGVVEKALDEFDALDGMLHA